MKKKVIILVCLLLTMCLYGCGGSNSEPVNMEAFRCQDSIETVFEVLGETEIDIGVVRYYEYEKVNLWGNKGVATFYVREDDETIKYFEGEITLNDKESLELISYFSDKYGDFEFENLKNGDKKYCWQLQPANKKVGFEEGELGFSKVTLTIEDVYEEESKHEIIFRDEWSTSSDEVYFEALEKSQKPESGREIVGSKEYKYDGATMGLTFSKDEDELFYFSITLDVQEKWRGAGVYTYVASFVKVINEQLADKGITSTALMICDDAVISNILSYSEEGELIDVTTWLMEGYQDENFDADECQRLWEQMEDDIYYYLLGDEYLEYKNK